MLHGSRLNHTPIYLPSSRNHGSVEMESSTITFLSFWLISTSTMGERVHLFDFFGVNKTMDPMKQFMDPMKRIQCQGTNCSHVS